jgi:hypothetical protein
MQLNAFARWSKTLVFEQRYSSTLAVRSLESGWRQGRCYSRAAISNQNGDWEALRGDRAFQDLLKRMNSPA